MPVSQKSLTTRLACLFLLVFMLGGCATVQNPRDPFEPFNRAVYDFNEGFDKVVARPVAEVYRTVLPSPLRQGVRNFFSNLNDVLVALNNLLQGKFHAALNDFSRIVINTSIGLLGILDVASAAGIEKNDEDFGQTLGWWGIGDGPFIVLPFLGPSTGRDVVGRVGDYFTDPVGYVDPTRARNQLWGTRAVNRRAELLDASTILQTAALDPYEFVRDAYLQRRRSLIHDGAPPPDREFLDPPPKPAAPVPKPQSSVPMEPAFTATADLPVDGSVLVSGEAEAPVLSPLESPAPVQSSSKPQPDEPSRLSRLWRALQGTQEQ